MTRHQQVTVVKDWLSNAYTTLALILLVFGAVWKASAELSALQNKDAQHDEQIRLLGERLKSLESIDKRLWRIEGKLGIKD